MKCNNCQTGNIKKLVFFGKKAEFCNTCTPCPRCKKPGAKVDSQFGVLNCETCNEELRGIGGPSVGDTRSFHTKEEYWATPFWKHMGLKPKQHEVATEREMKRRGLSYLDLQRERNKNAKPNPEMKKITDLALKGELVNHVKKINDNRRQRPSSKSS